MVITVILITINTVIVIIIILVIKLIIIKTIIVAPFCRTEVVRPGDQANTSPERYQRYSVPRLSRTGGCCLLYTSRCV